MKGSTETDLGVGDWIRYRDPTGGGERIAEIRSFYPFATEPTADTTHGLVPISAIVEVRSKPHVCDRRGRPERVVDESTDPPIAGIYPTCSVCGVPQVFPRSYPRSGNASTAPSP
jgi:hypothetical protein